MMRFLPLLLVFAGSGAHAALIADQVSNAGVSGGISSGGLIQSFTPAADNLAGVDIYVHGTGALVTDVTVRVYSDSGLTNLIATDTVIDQPRGTFAQLRWGAVAVVPEQLYYFDFDLSANLTLGTSHIDAYTRGEIINSPSINAKDFQFTTYSDSDFSPVPVPAAAWLFGSALLGLGISKRRKS